MQGIEWTTILSSVLKWLVLTASQPTMLPRRLSAGKLHETSPALKCEAPIQPAPLQRVPHTRRYIESSRLNSGQGQLRWIQFPVSVLEPGGISTLPSITCTSTVLQAVHNNLLPHIHLPT